MKKESRFCLVAFAGNAARVCGVLTSSGTVLPIRRAYAT